MLFAALPLFDGLLATLVLYRRASPRLTLREASLVSATLLVVWLVLGIEGLSLVHAIRFWPVLGWWLVPLPILVPLLVKGSRRALPRWPRLTAFDTALAIGLALILAWSWTQAVFSPPNNVDSQEYHLQRQVFWQQQGSVEDYPTSNLRQVAMPPLTEFAGLTLMVLTGNDHCHNLVQWSAFLLTLGAVSLTVRRFNRSPTAQLLAAVWTATIPLAFMQASTTKNDVVVMLFACLVSYWTLLLFGRSRLRWAHVALIGIGFGALALTKGTGVIFGLPIGATLVLALWQRHRHRLIPALAVVAVVALAINAGHFTRNLRAFGSVAPDQPGIHDGPSLGNADHSFTAVASNMIRTAGSHFVTPSKAWNEALSRWMLIVHQKLGRDLNDPRNTWMPGGRFRPYDFWQNDEDKAAAPAHMLLFLLLSLALFWTRREIPWWPTAMLLASAALGFLLFCYLLKWQNWHVRLVIVLPALIAPVFGWVFGQRRLRYAAPVAALFLLVTLVPSLSSIEHPMWGPKTIFSADPLALRCYYHPIWADEYRALVARIEPEQPRVIGFFTGASSPDYPMQRLLLDRFASAPTFTAFNAKFEVPGKIEPDPDVLIVTRSNLQRMQHRSTGTWYVADAKFGRYTVFEKER